MGSSHSVTAGRCHKWSRLGVLNIGAFILVCRYDIVAGGARVYNKGGFVGGITACV